MDVIQAIAAFSPPSKKFMALKELEEQFLMMRSELYVGGRQPLGLADKLLDYIFVCEGLERRRCKEQESYVNAPENKEAVQRCDTDRLARLRALQKVLVPDESVFEALKDYLCLLEGVTRDKEKA